MSLRFDLHQLGWYSFEQLCRTIVRVVHGQPVEAFSRGKDGGRDGFLYGHWKDRGDAPPLPTVVQCKHFGSPDEQFSSDVLRRELPKIRRLVAEGLCEGYIIFTNGKLSGGEAEKVAVLLQGAGVKMSLSFGYEAICELLTTEKQLRALVPRLYGLGDLSEILDERAYKQAEGVLASMHDDLARLVPVGAHERALESMASRGIAVLIGRPGSGKTSIAASILLAAMDSFGSRPVLLESISDLSSKWNPSTNDQVFWADDVFGAQQFDHASTDAFNRTSSLLAAAIKKGARFILTSRDYVYSAAKSILTTSRLPSWDDAHVVISVEGFTLEEREQILYNHLRLGRQSRQSLRNLRVADLEAVAAHPNFLPELARRMGEPRFTDPYGPLSGAMLMQFVERPDHYLLEIISALDGASRAALGLVHLHGGKLESPMALTDSDLAFLARAGTTGHLVANALQALEGSFLRLISEEGGRTWRFQHPSISDAFRQWMKGQAELLGEYLSSAPVSELLRSIVCGEAAVEGAIVVPESLFGIVGRRIRAARMAPEPESPWFRVNVLSFLAHRCSDKFLRTYVANDDPELVSAAFRIGLMLYTQTSERDLALRLLSANVAPEERRRELVQALIGYALELDDCSFINDAKWCALFSESEMASLIGRLEAEVIPALPSFAIERARAWSPPSFEAVRESLEAIAARLGIDRRIAAAIQALEEAESEYLEEEEEEEEERHGRPPARQSSGRTLEEIKSRLAKEVRAKSVFDDLGS